MAVAELAGLLAGCFADLKAASQARRLDATTYLLSVCRVSVSLIDSLSVCLSTALSFYVSLSTCFFYLLGVMLSDRFFSLDSPVLNFLI